MNESINFNDDNFRYYLEQKPGRTVWCAAYPVKRNKERFPENFMFQLTQEEAQMMVPQNAIPSSKHLGGY